MVIPIADHAVILLVALMLDVIIGDPDWLYSRVPHPVVVIGRMIDWLDRRMNCERHPARIRRIFGCLALSASFLVAGAAGWILHTLLFIAPHGWLFEALAVFPFLAQRSLYCHVADVAAGFTCSGLDGARLAVARIVGRNPSSLDGAGICRAAIESLSENFSDGVLAPVFWYLLLGLPGLLAYKALNTADSMIGHRTDRHADFGWAAARLDDLANFIPARLAAGLIVLAAATRSPGGAVAAAGSALRHAGRHRSVNAGWPEAAMAGALGLRLAGPRSYGQEQVMDAWMGDGRSDAVPDDICRALRLYLRVCAITALVVAVLAAVD